MGTSKSLALGKVGGKLGNLIFQSYNGKTYFRQLNKSISTEPTENQKNYRKKYAASISFWWWLRPFLIDYNNPKSDDNTSYSFYLKLFNPFIAKLNCVTDICIYQAFKNQSFGNQYGLAVTKVENVLNEENKYDIKITFDPNGKSYLDEIYIALHYSNYPYSHSNGQYMRLSPIEIENKTKYYSLDLDSPAAALCFISSPKNSLISNIQCYDGL